jgi:hypothetical protein
MSCCGKLIQSVETVARIAEGAMWELLDQHFRLPAEKCSLSGTRLAICRACESGTYLNKNEYWTWVDANGGKQKFLSDIGDLTGWPPLPSRNCRRLWITAIERMDSLTVTTSEAARCLADVEVYIQCIRIL